MLEPSSSALAAFLPDKTLDYFDLTTWSKNEDTLSITLVEKDEPPLSERNWNTRVVSKGFHDITITDFPVRGRRTLLTFRRRYWQIEGCKELLKRTLELTFPGTQLEKEFADFLKEASRHNPDVALLYRPYVSPSDQGI